MGAAFALTYGKSDVYAGIGNRAAGVSAGTLAVTAASEHEEENYSTAGTDPFEGVDDDFKDFALDASVAINILDNDVKASIAKGGKVKTKMRDDGLLAVTISAESSQDVSAILQF